MKALFPPPSRHTQVKFLAQSKAVSCADAFVILDSGSRYTPRGAREVFQVPGGEEIKRWVELEKILAWLAASRAERSERLIVIGGGATLDLGAMAASLYRRGMPLVLVPTTLLGMVDATLGGKTAVDFKSENHLMKNFAGTFYPAKEVWICEEFLSTLPPRERRSGAGEVLKTMWIRGGKWNSKPLLSFVNEGSGRMKETVKACLETKAGLVARDPLDEKRIREVLNFGHTVGHALESVSELSHGECVLWGMLVEVSLLGKKGAKMRAECERVVAALGLEKPPEFRSISHAEWVNALSGDKKRKGGRLEMSLLSAPGKIVRLTLEPGKVAEAIRNA